MVKMKPKAMLSVMLRANGMMTIVRNVAMALAAHVTTRTAAKSMPHADVGPWAGYR
jgi:hypothetical protein